MGDCEQQTYALPKIINDKREEVDKPKDQYTTSDWDKRTKNSRAKHILYYANEYNIISTCDKAKHIWNKLVVTYEGTSQVQEIKKNTYVH